MMVNGSVECDFVDLSARTESFVRKLNQASQKFSSPAVLRDYESGKTELKRLEIYPKSGGA